MQNSLGIFWLRDDFRLIRNDELSFASQNHEKVVIVYLYKKDLLSKFINPSTKKVWCIWLPKSSIILIG